MCIILVVRKSRLYLLFPVKTRGQNVTASTIIEIERGKGMPAMELLMELLVNNPSEEPCEDNSPAIEEENYDVSDYDYNKRIWF